MRLSFISKSDEMVLGREVLKLATEPTRFYDLFSHTYISNERAMTFLAVLEPEGFMERIKQEDRILWQTTEKGRKAISESEKGEKG